MSDFENIKNIAYLGPECSFSEMAKDKFCEKHKWQGFSTPLNTIGEIVDYVAQNSIDTIGILPVENTHIPCMAKSIPINFSAGLFSAVWFSQ